MSSGSSNNAVELLDENGDSINSENPLSINALNKLVPEKYDEISLSYTGDNLTTVVYKLASVTVATLTLSYTGDNLTNVSKS